MVSFSTATPDAAFPSPLLKGPAPPPAVDPCLLLPVPRLCWPESFLAEVFGGGGNDFFCFRLAEVSKSLSESSESSFDSPFEGESMIQRKEGTVSKRRKIKYPCVIAPRSLLRDDFCVGLMKGGDTVESVLKPNPRCVETRRLFEYCIRFLSVGLLRSASSDRVGGKAVTHNRITTFLLVVAIVAVVVCGEPWASAGE